MDDKEDKFGLWLVAVLSISSWALIIYIARLILEYVQ